MLEINAEIVGGIGKPVCAEIGWKDLVRFGRDIDTHGGLHGCDVFFRGEPLDPLLSDPATALHVVGGIDASERPDCPVLDPFPEGSLLLLVQRIIIFRHLVVKDGLPEQALFRIAGHDGNAVLEGNEGG